MARRVTMTSAEYQEKHARRLKGAASDIRRGIEAVTDNPADAAIASKEKMVANFNSAMAEGKYEAGLRRVTLDDWRRKTIEVGIGRIPAGIDAAKAKVTAFADQLLPHVSAGQSKIAGMANVTIDDNINRMVTFVRHMAEMRRG